METLIGTIGKKLTYYLRLIIKNTTKPNITTKPSINRVRNKPKSNAPFSTSPIISDSLSPLDIVTF